MHIRVEPEWKSEEYRASNVSRSLLRAMMPSLVLLLLLILSGCEKNDPNTNTPTSGRLLLLVEEPYMPLMKSLVDSFTQHVPNASIELQGVQSRRGVIEMINRNVADTAGGDSATTVALIIGRKLLEDERQAIAERGWEKSLQELVIGYDGLALVSSPEGPVEGTTLEQIRKSLKKEGRTGSDIDSAGGANALTFYFPSLNSSAYAYVQNDLIGDTLRAAQPAVWTESVDSVIDQVAAGKGIGLLSWYSFRHDSNRVRPLRVGYTDSTGSIKSPVDITVPYLVMNRYPMKLPLVGYTLAGRNSLSQGFLSWVALSAIAQRYLVDQGLEPENMRFQFTVDEEE